MAELGFDGQSYPKLSRFSGRSGEIDGMCQRPSAPSWVRKYVKPHSFLLTNIAELPHSCFMVRYEQNQSFTGRDTFLAQLHEKFQTPATDLYHGRIALFGLGGIGKTQIALEYAYRYQSSYHRIYWISAETQAFLLDGYQKIAERAELQISHLSTVEVAERVISWLEQEESWLLVVDNMDDLNIVSMAGSPNSKFLLLPSTGQLRQHTLITTRNRHAYGIPAQGMEVTKLDQDASLELLYNSSKISCGSDSAEDRAAARIVKDLDHLPLAIDQAAAYIRQVAKTFKAFLTDYTEYRKDLINWVPQGIRQYPHTVATTWRMSFTAISTHNPAAVELLRLFSFLNPDGILIQFLQSGANGTQDDLRQTISHRIKFQEGLSELEKFSLVKRASHVDGQEMLIIHRLVQAVVKDELSDPDLARFRTVTVDICHQAFPHAWDEKTWTLCRLYVGQAMGPLMDPESSATEKSASVMNRVGWFLRDDGKLNDSEHLLMRSCEICLRILGAEHPDTLTSMNNLASTYWAQGRMAEAAALQEEVLEKHRRILGAEHPDMLTSMGNLALTYWAQGRMAEAAALQEEVLEKQRRILGAEHPDTLTSMNNLASTYWTQGRMAEAAVLEEEVLEKRRRILGAEHPDTLMSMNNLASTYRAQGRMAEAAALEEEVEAVALTCNFYPLELRSMLWHTQFLRILVLQRIVTLSPGRAAIQKWRANFHRSHPPLGE